MSTQRLTPIDAQTFWTSAKIPNDTFLLFGFAGVPVDLERAIDEARARASACAELSVRVDDGGGWAYPAWVRRDVDAGQFVVHDLEDASWAGCLAAVADLIADQVDAAVTAWRLHLFAGVDGVPGSAGPGTVAVLQISHALGGGGRTSQSAALMFGRDGVMPEVTPPRVGLAAMPLLGFRAARAHRRMVADTEAGLLPPAGPPRPVLRTNDLPTGSRGLRTVDAAARRAVGTDRHRGGADGHLGGAGGTSSRAGRRSRDSRRGVDDGQAAPAPGVQPLRHRGRRASRRRRPVATSRPHRGGRRRAPPTRRAPGDARVRAGLRGHARTVVALGHIAIRSARAAGGGDREHGGVQCQLWRRGLRVRRCTRDRRGRVRRAVADDGSDTRRGRRRRHRRDRRARRGVGAGRPGWVGRLRGAPRGSAR